MRAVAVTIPSAINPSPTMLIATSMFSRIREAEISASGIYRQITALHTMGPDAGHSLTAAELGARLLALCFGWRFEAGDKSSAAPKLNWFLID
jgi:hypothetical protein